jgi:hypothetical protein
MISRLSGLSLLAVILMAGSALASNVNIWYGGSFTGNVWNDSCSAQINSNFSVPVYISTDPDAYVANMHLPLGVNDTYIDSIPRDLCSFDFYPFIGNPPDYWDDASFLSRFETSPPNPAGFHSRSFLGFADLGGGPNTWLHFTEPTQILSFVVHIRNNSAWIGTSARPFQDGMSSTLSGPNVGDTVGGPGYTLITHYARIFFEAHSDIQTEEPLPNSFSVAQNYPNPFNVKTSVSFTLPLSANVTITIYNLAGQAVQTINAGRMDAGVRSVVWDASNVGSGVYFYKVTAGEFSKTMKATLLK